MLDPEKYEINADPAFEDALTILIADDNQLMRNLLQTALTKWGYQVIEARDGEEAWEIMQQPNAPQILILDWLMPKLNGLVLCKRIRQELDFYPYIIFLTQVTGVENILKAFEAGADEFLLKPVIFPELRIRIFACEKIIKYLRIIAAQKKQLQNYALYSTVLEQVLNMIWRNCK